jgi:hypothetical protein
MIFQATKSIARVLNIKRLKNILYDKALIINNENYEKIYNN